MDQEPEIMGDVRVKLFTDDDIRRVGLPKDVFDLIHDLCYHHDGRDVYDYVRRAKDILRLDNRPLKIRTRKVGRGGEL